METAVAATKTIAIAQWNAETFAQLIKKEGKMMREINEKSLSKTKARALLNLKWNEGQEQVEAMVVAHNKENGVPALKEELDDVREILENAKIEHEQEYIDYLQDQMEKEASMRVLVRYDFDEDLKNMFGKQRIFIKTMSANRDLFNLENGNDRLQINDRICARFTVEANDERATCDIEIVEARLKFDSEDMTFYLDNDMTIETFQFSVEALKSDFDWRDTTRVLYECCHEIVLEVVNKLTEAIEK